MRGLQPSTICTKTSILPIHMRRHRQPRLGTLAPRADRQQHSSNVPTTADIFSAIDRDIAAMQRQMDAPMDAAFRRAEVMPSPSDATLQSQGGTSGRSWRREWSSETGNSRAYYSETVTVYGPEYIGTISTLSPTVAHPISDGGFTALLLGAGLLFGAWMATTVAFIKGYHLTAYSKRWRCPLVALWPLLVVISSEFRAQMQAALEGRRGREITGKTRENIEKIELRRRRS